MAKSVLIMIYWGGVGKRWVGKRRVSEYGGMEMHPVGITGIGIRSKKFTHPKNVETNSEAWIFITFKCVFIMDSTWQALQTNGIFFICWNHFSNQLNFLNNSGVGIVHARWGRHLCWRARVLVEPNLIIDSWCWYFDNDV